MFMHSMIERISLHCTVNTPYPDSSQGLVTSIPQTVGPPFCAPSPAQPGIN